MKKQKQKSKKDITPPRNKVIEPVIFRSFSACDKFLAKYLTQ